MKKVFKSGKASSEQIIGIVMKKNYKNLLQNLGIFSVANLSTKILNFLILPLYTFYLTTEQYGTVDLVTTTIGLLFPILSLSIVDAVLRFGLEGNNDKEDIFAIGLKLVLMGTFVLAIGATVARLFVDDVVLLCSFVLIYFFQAINQLFGVIAKVINKTKEMAMISTVVSASILEIGRASCRERV